VFVIYVLSDYLPIYLVSYLLTYLLIFIYVPGSEAESELASSTTTETISSLGSSVTAFNEDTCVNLLTPTVSNSVSGPCQLSPVHLSAKEKQLEAQVGLHTPEINKDWRASDLEENQPGGIQKSPKQTSSGNLQVETCTNSARTTANHRDHITNAAHNFHQAVSHLLHVVAETTATLFRRFVDSVDKTCRTTSNVVAAIAVAVTFLYFVFVIFYEHNRESLNDRTRRGWVAALWSQSSLQLRHLSPPPM